MLMKICGHCGRQYPAGSRCSCRNGAAVERNRTYDRTRRNRDRSAFYSSPAWEHVREAVKARAYGLDEYQHARHIMEPGDTAHHIMPLADDPDHALDPANLVWVSSETHGHIHKVYRRSAEAKAKLQAELRSIANPGGG